MRRLLTESDESATAVLLVQQLCREPPALRRRLREDFARNATTRDQSRSGCGTAHRRRPPAFPELAADDDARRAELDSMRAQLPARICGGRTWAEIEALIGQLRAGRGNLTAFRLAWQWRRAGDRVQHPPHLRACAAEYFDAILRTGNRARITQLATAMQLTETVTPARGEHTSVSPTGGSSSYCCSCSAIRGQAIARESCSVTSRPSA